MQALRWRGGGRTGEQTGGGLRRMPLPLPHPNKHAPGPTKNEKEGENKGNKMEKDKYEVFLNKLC